MSVAVLLCEGVAQGPDVRLLSALTSGLKIVVLPAGDKYGLAHRVAARREANGPSVVIAALRDCDFDFDISEYNAPGLWFVSLNNQQTWVGWHWQRVEVENYLVDPIVVTRALQLSPDSESGYREALSIAASGLAYYTAARYALSRSRPRGERLANRWGEPAGLRDHPLPTQRDDAACRAGVIARVEEYKARLHIDQNVLERYETACSEYEPGGSRYRQPYVYFSGKDLLCALHPVLVRNGWDTPGAFRERMLRSIERSTQPVWEWLPEWAALRQALVTATTNNGV